MLLARSPPESEQLKDYHTMVVHNIMDSGNGLGLIFICVLIEECPIVLRSKKNPLKTISGDFNGQYKISIEKLFGMHRVILNGT